MSLQVIVNTWGRLTLQGSGELEIVSNWGKVRDPLVANHQLVGIAQEQNLYDWLRNQIFQLEIAPGQLISLPEVANRYNVSLHNVRKACLRLESEGILKRTSAPGQVSFQVIQFNEDYIDQIFAVRQLLETSALSSFSGKSVSEVQRLRTTLVAQHTANDVRGLALNSYLSLDLAFHMELGGWSGNIHLSAAISQIMWMSTLIRRWQLSRIDVQHGALDFKRAIDEHLGILDAVAKSKTQAAAILLTSHILQEHEAIFAGLHTLSDVSF